MAKVQSNSRCSDCVNCRIWGNDKNKATCDAPFRSPMKYHDGFHPDQRAPRDCVDVATRRF